MPSALSLFYDSKWIKKHYRNMPKPLKDECSKGIRNWNDWDSSIADKVWTAYVRSPEYLLKHNRAGRVGVSKRLIPKKLIEYYDWIYAPLLEIKPELEKNLKSILFGKKMDYGIYFWDINQMHTGGIEQVRKIPIKYTYQERVINSLIKMNHIPTPIKKSALNEVRLYVDNIMALERVERVMVDIPQSIIDLLMIPKKPKTQTGWTKKMVINNSGYIPLFIYDFNNSNNTFLNWTTNPFA